MSDPIISGQANFALNLIRETGAKKSAAISPISISFALGMTLLGANGKTAIEIRDAIANDASFEEIHNHLFNVHNFIKDIYNSNAIKMANKIFFSEDLQIFDFYKKLIERYYNGNFKLTDFTDSQTAKNEINDFVADATNNEICDIIDIIDGNAQMVIVNALYFEKKWLCPFTYNSNIALFYSAPNVSKGIYLMQNCGNYNYAVTKNYQFLEIPYVNHTFSMFIVLPLEKFGLTNCLKTFEMSELLDLMCTANSMEVNVAIPKFVAESSFDLSKILQHLNINDAFDSEKADFSAATDSKIFISRVLHKVCVKVSEEGTIAAAATAVEDILISYEEEISFRADHPFLYFIADKVKNIYFIGTYYH